MNLSLGIMNPSFRIIYSQWLQIKYSKIPQEFIARDIAEIKSKQEAISEYIREAFKLISRYRV